MLVALDETERGRLSAIEERARENGVPGVRRLSAGELREIEPHVTRRRRAALPHHGDRRLPRRHPRARPAGRGPRRQRPLRCRGDGHPPRRQRRTPARVDARRCDARRAVRQGRALRRPAQRPPGGAGGRRARPADRAVPRRVLPAPSREAVARQRAGLPGARPALPVPGRAPDAAGRRRGDGRPERRARAGARGLRLGHGLAARPARDRALTWLPQVRPPALAHRRHGDGRLAEQAPVRGGRPPLRARAAGRGRRPRTERHPRPGARPRRQPGRRLPDQPADPWSPCATHRRPRRPRAWPSPSTWSTPCSAAPASGASRERPAGPRALGGARDPLRRRPRHRPRVAAPTGLPGGAGRGPRRGGPRRLRRGGGAVVGGAGRSAGHGDRLHRAAGGGRPVGPDDGGGGRAGTGLHRRRRPSAAGGHGAGALASGRRADRPPAADPRRHRRTGRAAGLPGGLGGDGRRRRPSSRWCGRARSWWPSRPSRPPRRRRSPR